MEPTRKQVGIVGAGMAGLACAEMLVNKGLDVTVFERAKAPGGRCSTEIRDGFALDLGAQFFFQGNKAVRSLANRLGLESSSINITAPFGILKRGRINDFFPSMSRQSFHPLVFLGYDAASWRQKWNWGRFLLWLKTNEQTIRRRLDSGETPYAGRTLQQFISEKFGHELFEGWVSPFVSGWFLTDPCIVDAATGLRFFCDLVSGLWSTMGGVGFLTKKAAERVRQLRLASSVEKLTPSEKGCRIKIDGKSEEFDFVVVATDATDAAQLLKGRKVADQLSGLEYVPAPVVIHGLDRRPDRIARRFAIIAPQKEGRPYKLIINSATKFIGNVPPRSAALHWFSAGEKARLLFDEPDDVLLESMEHQAHALFLDYPAPKFSKVVRWERAMVRPTLEQRLLAEKIPANPLPRIFLAGSYLQGEGVEGAIRSGREAAFGILDAIRK